MFVFGLCVFVKNEGELKTGEGCLVVLAAVGADDYDEEDNDDLPDLSPSNNQSCMVTFFKYFQPDEQSGRFGSTV